jgi:nucleoside-diphosphate-sugar epimerase
MPKKKILITGMGGLIGGLVRQRLQDRHEVSGLDRAPAAGAPCHLADIADLEGILPAFADKDVVVHSAAIVKADASWEEVLRNNIVGTYHVFEAARRAGVKRIVYVSSGDTITGWAREMPYRAMIEGRYDEVPERWDPLTHLSPLRPSKLYGCSKAWGEILARHFSDSYDLSILCVRSGVVNREDRPLQPRHFSVWCSQRDIAQMIERCVEAPQHLKFDIFFALSRNKWSYRDSDHAREVVGFEPQDAAENYR